MKYILVLLAVLFGFSADSAFAQNKVLFVGEINGRTVNSFKREEIIPHKNFRLQPISASTHRIEIRLYETDLLMGSMICTILTYDTNFTRKVFKLRFYDDSIDKPEEFMVAQKGLNAIFENIVSSGIFSIAMINHGEVKVGYQPKVLTPSGLDTTGLFYVRDGAYYFLEYKVDRYYDQEFFENPEAYSDFYKDNQTLRRQKEIVSALTEGIYN